MLLTGKGDIGAVDSVAANHVNDLVVFVRSGAEGAPTCGNVVKEVLDRELGALPAGNGFWVRRLSRFGGHQFPAAIVGPPGAIGVGRLGGHGEMGNVADAG